MDPTRAVERLTRRHRVEIEGRRAVCDPLLTLLKQARYPSLGTPVRGKGTGSMLNTQALALYEHIDGSVRAWLEQFKHSSQGELLELVKRLHNHLITLEQAKTLDDPERMLGMFQDWVIQIEACFDPPKEYELTGACPDCEATHVKDDKGELLRAVRVPVKPGRALVAECHACEGLWVGHEQLTVLAEQMGANVDWVKLRDFVDTPRSMAGNPQL